MKKWIYVTAVLAIATLLLFLFRLNLLFAFQRTRLPASHKFWAHRVNSEWRFQYLKTYFPGLEADAVYDRSIDNFRVYHPPAAQAALTLDTYLKQLEQTHLWIDVKDIGRVDYLPALNYFKRCDSMYHVRQQLIIETNAVELANLLSVNGFTASWMVPVDEAQIDSLKPQLRPEVTYVSQEDTYIPLLKKHFPQRKIITWALSFGNYLNRTHFNALIADTSIQVILVNCKSKGHI